MKKSKLFIVSALGLATVTCACVFAGNKGLVGVKAKTSHSITIDSTNYITYIDSFGNNTSNGNLVYTSYSNAIVNPGNGIMYSIGLNGGGFGIATEIQEITSVSMDYSVSEGAESAHCNFYLGSKAGTYEGERDTSMDFTKTTRTTYTVTAENPENCHYVTLWATGLSSDQAEKKLNIYSITIQYLCE